MGHHTVDRLSDSEHWFCSKAVLASFLINSNFGCHLTFQSLISLSAKQG